MHTGGIKNDYDNIIVGVSLSMKKNIVIIISLIAVAGIIILFSNSKNGDSKTKWEDLTEKQKQNVMYIYPEAKSLTSGSLDFWKDSDEGYKEINYKTEKEECMKDQYIYEQDCKSDKSILCRNDIIKKAEESADVSYDGIIVGKDDEAQVWSVSFYQYHDENNVLKGYTIKQRIYLNLDGSIRKMTKEISIEM